MFRVTKFILMLAFLLVPAQVGMGQACGNIYAKFLVQDSRGYFVDSVKFRLLRKDSDEAITYKQTEFTTVPEEGAYLFRHSLCGSHRGTRMSIEHRDFETFSATVDLPLNMQMTEHVFTISFARKGSGETSSIEQWVALIGRVKDAEGKNASNVTLRLTSHGGKSLSSVTSEHGLYSFSVREGAYTLEAEYNGEKVRHNALLKPGPSWQDVTFGVSRENIDNKNTEKNN